VGHFYGRDGSPNHFVTAKNGNSRASTIADAKKNGWCPSVTEILNILDKPALTNWKVEQAILAALTLPKRDDESEPEYLSRIKTDSGQQAKEAAEEGSRIHDAVDAHFKGKPFDAKYLPHVEGVLAKLGALFPGVNDWVSEKSFSSPLGFGGCCDLHSPSTGIVVDHKGKDIAPGNTKKLAYDQDRQLAAYQYGMGLPRNVGANLFISRTHPGYVEEHVWTPEQLSDAWLIFTASLTLWKAVKKFDPSY
jgi:hypothetical protein